MFRDTNNQAMQLVMQGYSDSIKNLQSNGIGNAFRAWDDSMNKAITNYHNAEQQKLNRALTEENIQGQKLNNEYSSRIMEDRVEHQAQQTKANQLANDYSERTLNDRVKQQALATEGMQTQNQHAKLNLDEAKQTSKGRVASMNAQYSEQVASSGLNAKKFNMEHDNYRNEPVYQIGGQYFYDSKGKMPMDKGTAEARIARNANKETYRREYQGRSLSDNRQVVTANQAQEAQNRLNMETGNASYQALNEANTAMANAGEDRSQVALKVSEAMQNGMPYVELNNGTKIPIQQASQIAGLAGYSGSVGASGGVVNNNNINTTFSGKVADGINVLQDTNASEEQKAQARAIVEAGNKTQVAKLYDKMGKYAVVAQQMQNIQGQNRLNTFLGFMTQYVGGDFAKEYGYLNAEQSNILTSLATSALSGALSNRDMGIVERQVTDIKKSGAFNSGALKQGLEKMIKDIEYSTQGMGGIDLLRPDARKQYESLKVLYQAL